MFFIGVVAINRLSLEENGGHIHLEHATSGLLLGRSEVLRELETLPAGTHHRSAGEARRGKKKRSSIFLEGTREGHRQSDEHWNRFKGNVAGTS